MAQKIVAINTLRPKVKRSQMAETLEIAKYISGRTTLNRGEIKNLLDELYETILHFNLMGRSVKFENVGVFFPRIDLNGTVSIGFKADPLLSKRALLEREYTGEILNSQNREKTVDELVDLWNQENPDDLIIV